MRALAILLALALPALAHGEIPTFTRLSLPAQTMDGEVNGAFSTEVQGLFGKGTGSNGANGSGGGAYSGVNHRLAAAWAPWKFSSGSLSFGLEQSLHQRTPSSIQAGTTIPEVRWHFGTSAWRPALFVAGRIRNSDGRSASGAIGGGVSLRSGLWRGIANFASEIPLDGSGVGLRYDLGATRDLTDWLDVGVLAWGNSSFTSALDNDVQRIAGQFRVHNSFGWIAPSFGVGSSRRGSDRVADWTGLVQIGIGR